MDNVGYARKEPTKDNLAKLYFMAGERTEAHGRTNGGGAS